MYRILKNITCIQNSYKEVHDHTKIFQIFDVTTQQNRTKSMNSSISNFCKISLYTLECSHILLLPNHPKNRKGNKKQMTSLFTQTRPRPQLTPLTTSHKHESTTFILEAFPEQTNNDIHSLKYDKKVPQTSALSLQFLKMVSLNKSNQETPISNLRRKTCQKDS